MNNTEIPEVRDRLRTFMQQAGQPIQFNTDGNVSIYGWLNWEADEHIRETNCTWHIKPGATLTEHTYSQFTDTFHDNTNEIGVNAYPAYCTCLEYTNQHLRWTGTLGTVLTHILKDNNTNGIQL